MKNFKINTTRDLLYPDVNCYQMDLGPAVEAAIEAGLVEGEMKELPSWSKFVASPIKAKGFFINMLKSVFEGTGNNDELNVDLQTGLVNKRRIAMMFLPENTKTRKEDNMLGTVCNIAQQTLSSYEVIELSGNTTTNKKAQKKVKEVIEKYPNKSILIIASKIAQRSFSIGEIDELYLAYDKGENGSSIQKMSRALTPDTEGKVGRIFSLSFNPNRDDKFDALLVQTAMNQVNKNPDTTDIRQELGRILRTVDIFNCTEDGAIPITVDDFVEEALSRKSISRVMGNKADIHLLGNDIIKALAEGNVDYLTNKQRDTVRTGKTRDIVDKLPTDKLPTPGTDKDMEAVKEMITTIIENADIIVKGTNQTIIREALVTIEEWNAESTIKEEFGVEYSIIKYLFEENIIKQEWINILHKS
jgi:predicted nucleic-acid-binding protein